VPRSAIVSLVHLGCARNLVDSEVVLARLAEQGLMVSGDEREADVVVLNTCSFIGPARQESEDQIRRLIRRKQKRELHAVVVAGCLVQRYQHALAKRFPEVDLWAEISDGAELARRVKALSRGEGVPRYLAAERPGAEREGSRMLATPGSYAYLRISHGCDHTCSFCAIPAIRGPHRSKSPDALAAEARELVDAGVKELVLVAEDLTAWGRDIGQELPALIGRLADLEGSHRLRLMYAYPNRFPWELTRLLREHPRVLPYLDIPVQHVATPVLRAMKRAGSGDQVRAILDRLLDEVPGLTLRTTLLLGFPGETEADAAEAVEFVRRYRIGRLGAFAYSPEEGTTSYELGGRVDAASAARRVAAVLAARDEVLAEAQRARIGSVIEILVDESHATRAVGRPDSDAPEVDLIATIEGSRAAVGERVKARVTGVDAESNLICGLEA
jgi:ribosomal protein S12 methylthiotransferase